MKNFDRSTIKEGMVILSAPIPASTIEQHGEVFVAAPLDWRDRLTLLTATVKRLQGK